MNRVLASLALFGAAFPLSAAGEAKEDTEVPPAITVYTQFDHDHSVLSFEEMRNELANIMQPTGLHFEWRSLQAAHGNEVSVELVVVTFKGTCSPEDSLTPPESSGALGWTHMSDGDVLPFSDVHCDRIRKFLRSQLASLPQEDRERAYGRALGRVLAHELYHVFTNTTRHASWGVAKAFYTPAELISDKFHFQEKESKALREGKLRSLLRGRHSQHSGFSAAGQ